jgi:hypothetical protein
MKFLKGYPENFGLNSIFTVNNDTFAELMNVENGTMTFMLRWKLSLMTEKNPKDYSKIVVKVKKDKTSLSKSGLQNLTQSATQTSNQIVNPISKTQKKQLPSASKASDATLDKILAGKKLLEDFKKVQEFTFQKEIAIPGDVPSNIINSPSPNAAQQYTYTEVYAPETRPSRKVPPAGGIIVSQPIDVKNVIQKVNDSLLAPSQVTTELFTSESSLYEPETADKFLKVGKSQVSLDYLMYFLYGIAKSQSEDESTWYATRQSLKTLKHYDMSTEIQIPIDLNHANLSITFELYKKDGTTLDEVFNKKLACSDHYEAFLSEHSPPKVVASISYGRYENVCNVSVAPQPGKVTKCLGYRVYSAPITKMGDVGNWKVEGNIPKFANNFKFTVQEQLIVVKVVPIEVGNNESHLFTEQIVGKKYEDFGSLVITPYVLPGQRYVTIDVYNIPKQDDSLTLWKRDCTVNSEAKFEPIRKISVKSESLRNVTLTDPSITPGNIFEYRVTTTQEGSKEKLTMLTTSNYVLFRHPRVIYDSDLVSVNFSANTNSVSTNGELNYSFTILSTMSAQEDQKITELISTLSPELYNYFLNPANITTAGAIPKEKYSEILVHEVVRTDLNTSERVVFPIMGDGSLVDDTSTRKLLGMKPINAQHDYLYQVFTYKRNPLTMFKDYVEYGVKDGKEWFFSPYKWRNPAVLSTGKLYREDPLTLKPVIDTYETYTSDPYGMSAQILIRGAADTTKITSVSARRLDVNTAKITWSLSGAAKDNASIIYDSFVVMKVVNGIRSFVGRTQKTYVYHELTEADLGSVYYIVVPIARGYDIDDTSYSNELFIDSEGITPVVPVPPPPPPQPPPSSSNDEPPMPN